jgi:hypothetical protein
MLDKPAPCSVNRRRRDIIKMPGIKPQERHRNGNAGQAGAVFGKYNVAETLRSDLSVRTPALL